MRTLIVLAIPLLILACSPRGDQQPVETGKAQSPALELVWETDTLFRTPESVLYDKERAVVYVSNVNMNPWEKDGNGFISKMDLQGNILELEWVTGLNGPKGMGILGNSLFVADIDQLLEIDIETGQIRALYQVTGTPALNDITVGDGAVYISGSDSNTVFQLKDGQVSIVLSGALGRPNGLLFESGRLLMITSNSSELKSIDLATKNTAVLVDSIGQGDGIAAVGNGDYLTSSWRGEVFYITSDWKRTQLLDTRPQEINAADIDYVVEEKLLLVPTFFKNRVAAYRLRG